MAVVVVVVEGRGGGSIIVACTSQLYLFSSKVLLAEDTLIMATRLRVPSLDIIAVRASYIYQLHRGCCPLSGLIPVWLW